MNRAVQPFATEFDGDVLYAVSTAELDRPVDESEIGNVDLDVLASEVMWDAILSSIPEQPRAAQPTAQVVLSEHDLRGLTGEYVFSPTVRVRVTARAAKLFAQATGSRDAYAIHRDVPVELTPLSTSQFTIPGRYPLVLSFVDNDRLVVNPGHWEQTGTRARP